MFAYSEGVRRQGCFCFGTVYLAVQSFVQDLLSRKLSIPRVNGDSGEDAGCRHVIRGNIYSGFYLLGPSLSPMRGTWGVKMILYALL